MSLFMKKYAMMICCFFMAIPLVALFTTDIKLNDFSAYATAAMPLLLCVGAHLLLHRFLCGKTVNSKDESKQKLLQGPRAPLLLAAPKKTKLQGASYGLSYAQPITDKLGMSSYMEKGFGKHILVLIGMRNR